MKIAIATDDFFTVTGHIGRCNGFIIYEINNGKIESRKQLENTFTNHRKGGELYHHGEGINEHRHGHSHLVDGLKGCSYLFCTAAGWRVVEDLKKNNIDVLFTNEVDADLAAQKFAEGKLEVSDEGVCRAH